MADTKKCMIIGAAPIADGEIFKEFNPKNFFVICADGGYDTALKYKIKPDYIVGDFDSAKTKPNMTHKNVKVLPVNKDVTDTFYAAHMALKLGYRDFIMVGCLGGNRADHTIANYNVMLYIANKGGSAVMVDNITKAFLLKDRKLRLTDMKGYIVSVFPFGTNTCNVSYQGLKYPLSEADLRMGDTLMGVSNEIVDVYAEIRVHVGIALVMIINNN